MRSIRLELAGSLSFPLSLNRPSPNVPPLCTHIRTNHFPFVDSGDRSPISTPVSWGSIRYINEDRVRILCQMYDIIVAHAALITL